jgi:hypothetical protein
VVQETRQHIQSKVTRTNAGSLSLPMRLLRGGSALFDFFFFVFIKLVRLYVRPFTDSNPGI